MRKFLMVAWLGMSATAMQAVMATPQEDAAQKAAQEGVAAMQEEAGLAPSQAADEAAAKEKADKELKQLAKVMGAMFGPPSSEPIDPARLALAQQTTAKIMPNGIYKKIMGGMFDKMFGSMLGGKDGMSDFELMMATGYEAGEKPLDPASRMAATQLLDPNYGARAAVLKESLSPMLDNMIGIIEPPMRDGLARAYARKFTPDQLTELNRFFATPIGGFYASESFALQADPEVMSSVMSALPAMLGSLKGPGADIDAKMKAIPKARNLAQLSDDEITSLAAILGTSADALKKHRDETNPVDDMAAADVNDPFAGETGDEPWWDQANWNPVDQKKMKSLTTQLDLASQKSQDAENAANEFETEAMLRTRDKYRAKGWKPEPAAAEEKQ